MCHQIQNHVLNFEMKDKIEKPKIVKGRLNLLHANQENKTSFAQEVTHIHCILPWTMIHKVGLLPIFVHLPFKAIIMYPVCLIYTPHTYQIYIVLLFSISLSLPFNYYDGPYSSSPP